MSETRMEGGAMSDHFGEWRRCPICKQHGFEKTHRCDPGWEVQIVDRGDEEWRTVHATHSEDAARKFAEDYDRNDGCYPIVSDGLEMTVRVRKEYDDNGPVEHYIITAEMVPAYYAEKVEPEDVAG